MKSKLAVAILALLIAAAARGENGVVIECPKSVPFTAIVPAGWSAGDSGQQPFIEAHILLGRVYCGYSNPNSKNQLVGDIYQLIPKGMTCKVNPSSARQFDCLPIGGPAPGTILQPITKR